MSDIMEILREARQSAARFASNIQDATGKMLGSRAKTVRQRYEMTRSLLEDQRHEQYKALLEEWLAELKDAVLASLRASDLGAAQRQAGAATAIETILRYPQRIADEMSRLEEAKRAK